MKKLLWVGDAACPTGFARATHETLDVLRRQYDVTVLGLNYRGDPHQYPYPIFTAFAGGDAFGVARFIWMCDFVKPDVIVIQQDGWNFPAYIGQLKDKKADGSFKYPEHANIPVVAAVAVDGANFRGAWLKDVAAAVFWTDFALSEARAGGYQGDAAVIPLGVDLQNYKPVPKDYARSQKFPPFLQGNDVFIVGNVNRNQPRKRWDLTLKYFAEWIISHGVENAWLCLHAAPTGDAGINVAQLAKYYGIENRIALITPPAFYGVSEAEMSKTYNCFDVMVSTTQGEGMGLTAMEAMACGVPCILPDWSAFGDWARNVALLVPCTSTCIGSPYENVIGGVVDEAKFIEALDLLYADKQLRESFGSSGLARMQEPRFRWEDIGQRFMEVVDAVANPHPKVIGKIPVTA